MTSWDQVIKGLILFIYIRDPLGISLLGLDECQSPQTTSKSPPLPSNFTNLFSSHSLIWALVSSLVNWSIISTNTIVYSHLCEMLLLSIMCIISLNIPENAVLPILLLMLIVVLGGIYSSSQLCYTTSRLSSNSFCPWSWTRFCYISPSSTLLSLHTVPLY